MLGSLTPSRERAAVYAEGLSRLPMSPMLAFQLSSRLIQDGKREEAASLGRELVSRFPDLAYGYLIELSLAVTEGDGARVARLVPLVDERIEETDVDANESLAVSLRLVAGEQDRAIELFSKCLAEYPENWSGHLMRGLLLESQSAEEAARDLAMARDLSMWSASDFDRIVEYERERTRHPIQRPISHIQNG